MLKAPDGTLDTSALKDSWHREYRGTMRVLRVLAGTWCPYSLAPCRPNTTRNRRSSSKERSAICAAETRAINHRRSSASEAAHGIAECEQALNGKRAPCEM